MRFGFSGPTENGGVVVLETQRILGGDSGFYYVGTYNLVGSTLAIQVRLRQHNPGVPSIFGPQVTDITLKGDLTLKGLGQIEGHIDYHGRRVYLSLTQVAPLP